MHCNVPKIDEWHLFAALAIIKMICCSTFWVQTINQIFAHLLDDLMQCRVTIGLSFWYLHWWLNFRNPRVRTATRMRKSMRGHRISIMSLIWNPWAKWKYYSNRHKVECQLDHFHNIPNCSISNQKKKDSRKFLFLKFLPHLINHYPTFSKSIDELFWLISFVECAQKKTAWINVCGPSVQTC